MSRRHAALILVGVILSGCSGAGVCGNEQPETVMVDAATYAEPGTELEVCIFPEDEPENADCNAPGDAWVSATWLDEYPDTIGYSVIRTNADGSPEPLTSGSYGMQCLPGTVRIELGVRPGQE